MPHRFLPPAGSGAGSRAACKLDAFFQRWQLLPFCPGVVCLSHCRHVAIMRWESSQAAIRRGWGRVGAAAAAARPMHPTGWSWACGGKLLGTGCGTEEQSPPPPKPAVCRASTCFLQRIVIVFPNCSAPLVIRLICVRFPYIHICTSREVPRFVVPVWSSQGRFSSFPTAKRSCVTLGKPDTPRALEVSGCLPPTEPTKNGEPAPYQGSTDVRVPYLPGPL